MPTDLQSFPMLELQTSQYYKDYTGSHSVAFAPKKLCVGSCNVCVHLCMIARVHVVQMYCGECVCLGQTTPVSLRDNQKVLASKESCADLNPR